MPKSKNITAKNITARDIAARNITARVITAIVMLVVMAAILLSPPLVFKCFLVVCVLVIGYELSQLFNLKLYIVGITLVFMTPLTAYFFKNMLIASLIIWVIIAFALKFIATKYLTNKYCNIVLYLVSLQLILISIFCFDLIASFGIQQLLILVCLVAAIDIFGYVVGKKIGTTKIVPAISSGKSLQGYLAALIIIGCAMFIMLNYDFVIITSKFNLYLLALIVFLFAIVGDLYFSAIKRRANVKDSSNLLPGHGLLDRLDHIAAAPIYYYLVIETFA